MTETPPQQPASTVASTEAPTEKQPAPWLLQRLQDVSKIVVVPTAALYFCGFLCVMGYLSRFGIITYDVINARFLIAGLLAFFSLTAATWAGWWIYRIGHPLLKKSGSRERLNLWLVFLAFPWTTAYALHVVFKVGTYIALPDRASFTFSPIFGKWDLFGNLLANAHWPGDEDWIIKSTLNVALYPLSLFALAGLLEAAVSRIGRALGFAATTPTAATGSQAAPPASTSTQAPAKWRARLSSLLDHLAPFIELVAMILIVVLAIYSYYKLRAELFDLGSMTGTHSPDLSVTFAWVYGTTFAVIVAQWLSQIDLGTLLGGEAKEHLRNPANVADLLTWLIVPLLLSLFLFGATVFPRIPFSIGGGEPREVVIVTRAGEWERSHGGTAYLLGESNQHFFVVVINANQGTAYQLAKSEVVFLQTKRDEIKPHAVRPPEKPKGGGD